MSKTIHPDVLDLGLQVIKDNCDEQLICSSQPTTRADALSKALASAAMVTGDFTLANGDAGGRKITIAAKPGTAITVTGTANVYALIDNTRLLATTDITNPQVVTAGNTANIPAWKITKNDPS
jgi:hypothetical protein